jgi:hypothetical protein
MVKKEVLMDYKKKKGADLFYSLALFKQQVMLDIACHWLCIHASRFCAMPQLFCRHPYGG